jgi:hypothetical protein
VAKPPLTVPIAGYWHYRGARERLLTLALGTPLRLVREPDHPKDSLAVQVWAEDQMLGFVPRANNVDVAWALDGKVEVKAVFAGFKPGDGPAMQIVWP